MSLRLLEELDADAVATVRRIYEDAFPAELRAPFDDLLVDRMLVWVDAAAGDEPGGPGGLALVRDLADTGWTFLRYYAVGRRGQGLGSRMFRALTDELAAEGRTRLVWDVEHPDEPGLPDAVVEEHRRRIVFYERLGGRVLPVREYRPPHEDGHAPPMLLLTADLVPRSAPERPEDVRAVVEAVYHHRYGRAPDDPAVQWTLAASGLI